ncbi:MAG: ABC transporter permease [bacterium]
MGNDRSHFGKYHKDALLRRIKAGVVNVKSPLNGFALARRTVSAIPSTVGRWIETVVYEVRHSLRRTYRHRWFAFSTVLSLAIGLGATVAVFALEDVIDFRALPYEDSDRLVSIQLYRSLSGFCGGCRMPSPEALTRRIARSPSLAGVSAYRSFGLAMRDEVGTDFIRATEVTPEHFKLLGVKAMIGRVIQPPDLWPSSEQALVASYDFWRTALNADAKVVGRQVTLVGDADGLPQNFRVIGVMPRRFDVPANTGVWVAPHAGGASWILARLKPGISHESIDREVRAVLTSQAGEDALLRGATAKVLSLRDDQRAWSGVTDRRFLLVAVAILILVLASTNIVTLFLSRLAAMNEELATRAALGAGMLRLMAQLLTDILVLGLIGATGGLWVAYSAMELLTKRLGFAGVPVHLNGRVVLFALGLAIVVSCAIGVAGALAMRQPSIVDRLRSSFSARFEWRRTMQSAAIVVQVAGAVLLTSAALQGIQQLLSINQVELGFNPAGLVRIVFPSENQVTPSIGQGIVDTLRRRVATDIDGFAGIRGVLAAAAQARPPQDRVQYASGSKQGILQSWGEINQVSVTEHYFRTIGVPIVLGQAFTEADRQGSPSVGIVNRSAGEKLWPGASPIGRTLVLRNGGGDTEQLTIVGMVADVRFSRIGPTSSMPLLYRPFAQLPSPFREYWIRNQGESRVIFPRLFQAVTDMRPLLRKARFPVIQSLSEQLDREIAMPRLNAVALSGLAICAAALAAIGTFGIVAYAVRVRTREIGIRLALGAPTPMLLRTIAGGTVVIGALGIVLGVICSFVLDRLIRVSFSGLEPPDKMFVLAGGVASAVVILAATYWPAKRVLKANPADSLRLF